MKGYSEGKGIHTQPHTCWLREEDYSSVVWTCWKLNPQCNRADRPGPWELITLWGRGVREKQCCYHRRVLVAECVCVWGSLRRMDQRVFLSLPGTPLSSLLLLLLFPSRRLWGSKKTLNRYSLTILDLKTSRIRSQLQFIYYKLWFCRILLQKHKMAYIYCI